MQGQETPCIRATAAACVARAGAVGPSFCHGVQGAIIKVRLRVCDGFQRAALYVGATWLRRGCRIVGCMPSSTNSQIWWDIR